MNTILKEVAKVQWKNARNGLDEKSMDVTPLNIFTTWLKDAADSCLFLYPNAMTLSTASKTGIPASRIVLLKHCDERGFVFYTSYKSKKANDLKENPRGVLLFYWPVLERQVTITGKITKVSSKESDEYFKTRKKVRQIGAWASPQSKVINGKKELDQMVDKYQKQFAGQPISRPDDWGGYRLSPKTIEFWLGKHNRLHDRILYTLRDNGKWLIQRLAP